MQVSNANNVKVYNLSAGKSLPEWISDRKKRTLLKNDSGEFMGKNHKGSTIGCMGIHHAQWHRVLIASLFQCVHSFTSTY